MASRRTPSPAQRRPYFIDLFAGCGGLSEGFRKAGWNPVFAVDKDPSAAASYRANFGWLVWTGLVEDFVKRLKVAKDSFPEVDAVIGGPPCQGFSPLGKMSAKAETRRGHEAMNNLWKPFLKVVEILQPKLFVTENVPQFLRSEEFIRYKSAAKRLDYELECDILKAEEFGVPQKRRRAFCIGSRVGPPVLPSPNGKRRDVWDAIGHLPSRPTDKNWHDGRHPTAKSIERYKAIPRGGNRFDLVNNRRDLAPPCWVNKKTGTTDVFGRLLKNEPAGTIRTEFFKPEKGRYLHPVAHRPITHREAACLQSFPDSFEFVGSKIRVARQIGEAVPPDLAAEVAREALELLATADLGSADSSRPGQLNRSRG